MVYTILFIEHNFGIAQLIVPERKITEKNENVLFSPRCSRRRSTEQCSRLPIRSLKI
jgi:hypothetical protein